MRSNVNAGTMLVTALGDAMPPVAIAARDIVEPAGDMLVVIRPTDDSGPGID